MLIVEPYFLLCRPILTYNLRTRCADCISFWQHISHPNITPLLAHLSTSSHHILVLPYLPGGDLLGLVNSDVAWGKLGRPLCRCPDAFLSEFFQPPGESVLRRIWCELCKAVGWMHGVGLVHRDIKLESQFITSNC